MAVRHGAIVPLGRRCSADLVGTLSSTVPGRAARRAGTELNACP